MDLTEAVRAHSDWKIKFRSAIAQKSKLNGGDIGRDDQCALGKWLHGESQATYGPLDVHKRCVQLHASFHREAAKIAALINAGNYQGAESGLGLDSAYTKASSDVMSAIYALKRVVSP